MDIKNLQQEHDKQNEAYVTEKAALFSDGGGMNEAKLGSLANDRLNRLNAAIADISDIGENYVDAVDLFVSFFDDVILECAEFTGRRKEIETNLYALCRKALEKAAGKRDAAAEHTIAVLFDNLDTPTKDAAAKMENALLDDTNPLRFGLSLYFDFCEKNAGVADADAHEYLKTEADARIGLIKGLDEMTFNALEKLLTAKIDRPEKYLLTALNSFYHGFLADAERVLEIGLSKFPENERLLSAKGAIAQ